MTLSSTFHGSYLARHLDLNHAHLKHSFYSRNARDVIGLPSLNRRSGLGKSLLCGSCPYRHLRDGIRLVHPTVGNSSQINSSCTCNLGCKSQWLSIVNTLISPLSSQMILWIWFSLSAMSALWIRELCVLMAIRFGFQSYWQCQNQSALWLLIWYVSAMLNPTRTLLARDLLRFALQIGGLT